MIAFILMVIVNGIVEVIPTVDVTTRGVCLLSAFQCEHLDCAEMSILTSEMQWGGLWDKIIVNV